MAVDQTAITANVKSALAEDIGDGDMTATLIPATTLASATLVTHETAILAGCAWFDEVFKRLDQDITITWNRADAETITPGQTLCRIVGRARSLLAGERVAINFLQTLSGTATTVANFVNIIKGTKAKLLDTRKTIPGLRHAQKYAVTCGGGINHRLGLYDSILIKENHIMLAGNITQAVKQANVKNLPVAVEVETLDELKEALNAEARRILLDNFTIAQLTKAVAINQHRAKLEASGNINEHNLYAVAMTGVDYISVGALTKHIRAIDFSMRMSLNL